MQHKSSEIKSRKIFLTRLSRLAWILFDLSFELILITFFHSFRFASYSRPLLFVFALFLSEDLAREWILRYWVPERRFVGIAIVCPQNFCCIFFLLQISSPVLCWVERRRAEERSGRDKTAAICIMKWVIGYLFKLLSLIFAHSEDSDHHSGWNVTHVHIV